MAIDDLPDRELKLGMTKQLDFNDGIWYSKSDEPISYPDTGNSSCMQVEEHSFWFKHRNRLILSALSKFADPDIFYDIGGGNGFVSQGIQRLGFSPILIEPGQQGAFNAKTRGIKNVICGKLEHLDIADQSIPYAGLFDVLEHLENDQLFLNYLSAKMEPRGKVFITVPAFRLLWSVDDVTAGHFRRYSIPDISQKLNEARLKVIYRTYFFSALLLPVYLFRAIPWRLGFNQPAGLDVKRLKRIHGTGLAGQIMYAVLRLEEQFLLRSIEIPLGSSILIVGERV